MLMQSLRKDLNPKKNKLTLNLSYQYDPQLLLIIVEICFITFLQNDNALKKQQHVFDIWTFCSNKAQTRLLTGHKKKLN